MNYTKLIREYCKNNSGAIFDVSKLKDTEFAEAPYKKQVIEKELFERLQQQYSPIISNIINSDVRFYRTNQTIRWGFGYNERVAIFAWCNRKTNIVTVNIAAVDFALQQNEPLDIEYFLLHEIRHIYQHLEIEDYRNDPTKCNNAELAKKWSEEEDNYVTALNKEGKENTDYFLQDMEMDAFAYAYAVMKYKYGEVKYLYLPEVYHNDEFDKIVNEWQVAFKNEGL